MNIQVGANAGKISQNSMCNDRVQCGKYSVHATRKSLEALRSYFSLICSMVVRKTRGYFLYMDLVSIVQFFRV